MLNKTLLIIIILFIFLIILLNFFRNKQERFEDLAQGGKSPVIQDGTLNEKDIEKTQNVEIIENTIINGSFKGLGNELYKIKLDNLEIAFDYKNPKSGLVINLDKINKTLELALKKDISYNFKIAIYPLEQLLLLLLKEENSNSSYKLLTILRDEKVSKENQILTTSNNFNISIEKNNQQLENLKDELFKFSKNNKFLNVEKNEIKIITKEELGDKKTTIWNVEKIGKRPIYTIRNIVNNLFLTIKEGKLTLDSTNSKSSNFYIIKNNDNYVIINEDGYVLNVEQLEQSNDIVETKYEAIENIGNWLTYNSTINLVNEKNLYLSGNINVKYNITNTAIVYVDELATKELIQWVIEDYSDVKRGFYVKDGNDIFLKNNGLYLQILKGNNSPTNSGFEISLGDSKNDNSRWVIRNVNSERLFRRKTEILLYHPKMNVYLYSTNNLFKVLDADKLEVIGNKISYKWKFDVVSSEQLKNLIDDVDYFKFTNDKNYFETKEKEWKKLLEKENEEIKKNLNRYNELVENEKKVLERIKFVENEITNIEKEKCPPRKVCLEKVHYDCIRKPKSTNEKEKLNSKYDIVYIRNKLENNGNNYLTTDSLKKCLTLNDFNIEESSYIKDKKYVPRKGAKLDISDFKISEFPEYADLVSIESLPEDKKIIDFKINELSGFDRLKLKSSY